MTKVIHECDYCAGRGYVPEPFSDDPLVMCPACGGVGRTEPPPRFPLLAESPAELRRLARQLRALADALDAAAGGPEGPTPAAMVLSDEGAA